MDKLVLEQAKNKLELLINEVETVIIGKRSVIQLAITALIADGHVLFEDIPGVGKTMLAKTLAKTIQCQVQRVQFTPDLLPSDIIGVSIYNKQQQAFEFKHGPVFTDLLLADEINRSTPRSQAALLEAMSEKQLTTESDTYRLSPIFFVMATQNPADYEGTYPLPEAQLDRFLFRLSIGYPSFQEEVALLTGADRQQKLAEIDGVMTVADIVYLKELVNQVYVDPRLVEYAVSLVRVTRNHPQIRVGISPRGSLAFIQAAKAYALTEGRDYCLPDDFKVVIKPVFSHRLLLAEQYSAEKNGNELLIAEILAAVAVPVKA